MRVHVNQDVLKLNGTHQLLVYADGIKIVEGTVYTINENAEALIKMGLQKIGCGGMEWI
jgi:hypothetical protein